MTTQDLRFWIALSEVKGIGTALLEELYGTLQGTGIALQEIHDLSPDEIRADLKVSASLAQSIPRMSEHISDVEADYFALLDAGFEILPFFSSLYPERLSRLKSQRPPFLYCQGELSLLRNRGIAILGEKSISARGELNAIMAARELSRHEIVTISGMAAGADMAAHRGALESGGSTMALVPYGMKHLKIPATLQEVLRPDHVLFISPFSPGTAANQYTAYERNRICVALSRATYIVEAPPEGGIIEAAKSALKLETPLYTTEYSEYPESAAGNRIILDEMKGLAVKGRWEKEILVPNMDHLVAHAKFDD